ncbi:MAG: DUF5939 domain-containing protein, partial [Acidobacteria bacterium]|nr:DUF5939 domain-containing protein [Acidobacteriota bacterium]
MSQKEFHYRWEYALNAGPEALWPLVADTNRFNRDAGVPALVSGSVASVGDARTLNARRRLRLSAFGVSVEWDEEPFEWIRPHRFGVLRRYRSGPVAEMRVVVELHERAGGGTRLVYEVWAKPKNALGRLAIPLQIGQLSARRFAEAFRRYDKLASINQTIAPPPPTLKGARTNARAAIIKRKLIEQGASSGLVARLVEVVESADDLTLMRLRPYALADLWNVPRRDVLELCLLATRAGLLDLRWELLCPLCRGAKQSSESLRDVRAEVHCDSCNIDFTVNFDRSVEVVFRVNPSVRQIEARDFCIGGPQVTPHIVAQQLIPASGKRRLSVALEEGRYRLRAHSLPGARSIAVTSDGTDAATLRAEATAWPAGELRLAPRPTLE